MLTKTLKRVKIKGRTEPILREQYLRDDILCHSPICRLCSSNIAVKTILLEKDSSHYVIPCFDIVEKYLEILELHEIKGIIILQSIASKVMQTSGHRTFNRLINISKDVRRGCVIFLNEICKKTYVPRSSSESAHQWLVKCCINTANFYATHINESIPVVLLTDDDETYKPFIKCDTIQVISMKVYLETMWKDLNSAFQLYESLDLAFSAGSIKDLSKSYDNYLPMEILKSGIKSGRFFKGNLRVNKYNASQEAFVASSKVFTKDSGDIFISGMVDRNRAIHGDEVVVELLPENQWKSRCMSLLDSPYDHKDDSTNASTISHAVPTGKVVGILDRCWRNYVATLPEEDEESKKISRKNERILVIPYDYRIPKIRIMTKQAENLQNQRIVVRIDSWEKDSQYPNGHLVQALGEIDDLETEIQSLLIEHEIFVGDFPKNLLSELPSCTEDDPWQLEESETLKRRDLRNSHLIFSIDPKGCEDVDDALSVKDLPNGMLELGVHIADVTHFVKPLSMVDLEARNRSTSIYLPDRRYDMLPHILSGNLCSLLGNVDRYAVSVLWELDAKCNVQSVWYGRTIIKSKYKMCYEAAQDILNNLPSKEVIQNVSELQGLTKLQLTARIAEVRKALSSLQYIANCLRKDRLHAGGLELSSINMKFEIDKMLPSVVSGVKSSEELAIHKIVAECMIFANHWVAKKIHQDFPHQALLRRHPNPREADLVELQKLATSRGFSFNIQSNKELASSLGNAIDHHDPGFNQILRILATQAMNQATYFCTGGLSISEFYHYGLGLEKYTHFTSPIRRYADVLVHRLLLAAVGVNNTKSTTLEMEEMCNHLNMKHKAAQDIEKAAHQLYLAFFIEDMNSKEDSVPCIVDSIIYAFRNNGMLVFVPQYGIKGAVCLCNKDKKVAFVEDDMLWVDGQLKVQETCLSVHSACGMQNYNIFDHITVSVKVLKSRSHQRKIVLDLVKNVPFTSGVTEIIDQKMEMLSLDSTKEQEENNCDKKQDDKSIVSTEDFNLYLFLEKIKYLSLLTHDDT